MALHEILAHFHNAKQVGENQYAVNCPACGDTKRHLYISESGGKILLDCKKGCTFGEIVFYPLRSDYQKRKIYGCRNNVIYVR